MTIQSDNNVKNTRLKQHTPPILALLGFAPLCEGGRMQPLGCTGGSRITKLHKSRYFFQHVLGVALILVLAGCSAGAEAVTTAAPLDQDAAEPTPTTAPTAVPPTEEPPASTPTEEAAGPEEFSPSALDAILSVVLERANDADRVASTLYLLMSVPVPGGESAVFHFEDTLSGVEVGCSGHALLQAAGDGSTYDVAGISAACHQLAVGKPVTAYPSQAIDEQGEAVFVVYGEVYDESVVAIRVFYEGGEGVAVISGGGYQAMLPFDAAGIVVRAYDAGGELLHEESLER